ncbi:MAG TPA: DeoR/GlpR transcriptional regulator [Arcobacter sp.]|nr:DeoR/GlpR transcriptional regulator [Arcobacter sp.]
MQKVERKFKIKLYINKKGQVSISDLAKNFNVTSETIRRDLTELKNENFIEKVHGRAISLQKETEDPLQERFYQNTKEKEIIALKAIKHLKENSRIFIDFGSTTLALCEEMSRINDLIIFTNSPLLAKTILDANSSHEVHIIGGKYSLKMHQNIGYTTINSILNEFVDLSIISTVAIDIEQGFFNENQHETEIARAMIKSSKECMLLADNSKINKNGIWKTCSFSQVHYLISEEKNSTISNICKKFSINYI